MGTFLTYFIPAAVLAYAAFVLWRMRKRRGTCCGGCAGCPMAGDCQSTHKENPQDV